MRVFNLLRVKILNFFKHEVDNLSVCQIFQYSLELYASGTHYLLKVTKCLCHDVVRWGQPVHNWESEANHYKGETFWIPMNVGSCLFLWDYWLLHKTLSVFLFVFCPYINIDLWENVITFISFYLMIRTVPEIRGGGWALQLFFGSLHPQDSLTPGCHHPRTCLDRARLHSLKHQQNTFSVKIR